MDSYEKQYHDNACKIHFDRSKIMEDPKQFIIASYIGSVKLMIPFYKELSDHEIGRFSAIVSHYPSEFTKHEKKCMYRITMDMVNRSENYTIIIGRLVQKIKL